MLHKTTDNPEKITACPAVHGNFTVIRSAGGKQIFLYHRPTYARIVAETQQLELWSRLGLAHAFRLVESFPVGEDGIPHDPLAGAFPQIPRPDLQKIMAACTGESLEHGLYEVGYDYHAVSSKGMRIVGMPEGEERYLCFMSLPRVFWENGNKKYLPARRALSGISVSRDFVMQTKPTIYYIHGFASGKNSSTGQALARQFSDVRILCYDSAKSFPENLKALRSQLSAFDRTRIFVGSSLGAYYAAKLYLKESGTPTRLILVNPVIKPQETLKRFVGENRSCDSGKPFTLSEDAVKSYFTLHYPWISTTILLADGDEILDARETRSHFEGDPVEIISVGGGHRLGDKATLVEAVRAHCVSPAMFALNKSKLSENERQVLTYRFGIKDGVLRSRKEVAKLFDETEERIAETEKLAMEKICGSTLYDYIRSRNWA